MDVEPGGQGFLVAQEVPVVGEESDRTSAANSSWVGGIHLGSWFSHLPDSTGTLGLGIALPGENGTHRVPAPFRRIARPGEKGSGSRLLAMQIAALQTKWAP